MKVKDIMSKKIISVKPEATFMDAALLMIAHKISGLPVIDEKGQCVGIVSEKDLLKKMFPTYEELFELDTETPLYKYDLENIEKKAIDVKDKPIKDFMKMEVIFVDPEIPILEAASMMILYRIRRLPVFDGRKIVGIVSQGDVFRAILKRQLILPDL